MQTINCYEICERPEKISSSQHIGFSDPRLMMTLNTSQTKGCEITSHQNAVIETLMGLCEIQII